MSPNKAVHEHFYVIFQITLMLLANSCFASSYSASNFKLYCPRPSKKLSNTEPAIWTWLIRHESIWSVHVPDNVSCLRTSCLPTDHTMPDSTLQLILYRKLGIRKINITCQIWFNVFNKETWLVKKLYFAHSYSMTAFIIQPISQTIWNIWYSLY